MTAIIIEMEKGSATARPCSASSDNYPDPTTHQRSNDDSEMVRLLLSAADGMEPGASSCL